MHMLADCWRGRHGFDDARSKIGGIRTGEAQAPQAIDLARRAKQIGKIVLAIVVAIDGLPQQGDLAGTLLHQPRYLQDNVLKPTTSFGATGVRDDAESAAVVTPPLYRHKSGGSLIPHGGDVLVVLPRSKLGIAHPLTGIGQTKEVGEIAVSVGPDHQVHAGHLGQESRSEALRHTSHDAEHVPIALVTLQLSQTPDYPLFGIVPHSAGVHQHHIGIGWIVGPHVAVAAEHAEHQLGVRHVHLAAVGLDVDAFHESRKILGWEVSGKLTDYGLTEIPKPRRNARSEYTSSERQTCSTVRSIPARCWPNRIPVPAEIPNSWGRPPGRRGKGS
jgi:hypothetical protein